MNRFLAFLTLVLVCTSASPTRGMEPENLGATHQTQGSDFAAPADETRTRSTPGRMRQMKVPWLSLAQKAGQEPAVVPRAPSIVLDGLLDDDLWKQAAVSTGFWNSLENRPPSDQTEVRVFSDGTYLYFGLRMYDTEPGKIQATKTVRDTGFGYDDTITIEMDTFLNRRDISEFSMNALGTQSDAIAGGRSPKIGWKGDWYGAATRTEYGWSAEFAIPFAILNFDPQNTIFGINFKRYQSRTREYSWWADVTPKNLPEEMGQLRGLQLPASAASDRKTWTFMPFLLAGKNIPDKEGDIKDTLITGGVDVRYQPRPNLTALAAINPDFSQLERAVTDISFSYTEKPIAETRPFLAEGAGYFVGQSDRREYFYSIRIPDFDIGGKGFGRVGRTTFGMLGTIAPQDRYDAAGRFSYEFDETHTAALTLTATSQNAFDNAFALLQFEGRQPRGLTYAIDAAATDTRNVEVLPLEESSGAHFRGTLGWRSYYWYLKNTVDQYDANYFPALGLLSQDLIGTRAAVVTGGYYRERSDRFLRMVDTYAGYHYRLTKDGDMLQRRKWFAGTSLEFRKDVRAVVFVEEGPYRRTTGIPGEYEDTLHNDRYYSTNLEFNTRSAVFSFGSIYDWGRFGGADYEYWSIYGWLRPISPVYLRLSYEQTDSFGVAKQTILVGSWAITPEDSLGARYIYFEDEDRSDHFIRIAYGRKARKGLDIFFVYSREPILDDQYSIKFVFTF
jgi:hypothetical protein